MFRQKNDEFLFKNIRELLVLHKIPIKKYSSKKGSIINIFYENLSENTDSSEHLDIFDNFISKINILKRIYIIFQENNYDYNKLIAECIFWALQIFEIEKKDLAILDNKILRSLASYINENKDYYKAERSSFSKILENRYLKTVEFFEEKYNIDLSIYIQTSNEFKEKEVAINSSEKEIEPLSGVETLRINKPEPSSITIEDIVRQMERERFLIRPPYQRDEVINKKKSSAIIESILLGIKIPPIFIYKRNDGISEVIDGQQRLLSILGYTGNTYLNEENKRVKSEKDGYSLNLKEGILKNYHGKKFKNLPTHMQDIILEFDLWKIDIEEKNNPNFDQIDLFVRLNYKPYPIKENTFEMWNSYIDREIIGRIKEIYKKNEGWFYFRKVNTRMDNENICTALSYIQYKLEGKKKSIENIEEFLDIYKIGDRINVRIKSQNEITKILESSGNKISFMKSCKDFESNFIEKIKLLSDSTANHKLEENLNHILNVERGRTKQSFYSLWVFLSNIPIDTIESNKKSIRNDLRELFISMRKTEVKATFLVSISSFWEKYQ